MSIKEKLKQNKAVGKLKQIKKPEKSKGVRKDTSKRTAFLVWSLILGMLFIAFLSILLSVNTRSTLNETNRLVQANENEKGEEEFSHESANEFLSNFIREYINVSNDSEALQERANKLKEYMAFNESFNNDDNALYNLEGVNGTRSLESFSLFNVEDEGNTSLYQYKVTFKNTLETEVEKEVGKGKKKETVTEIEKEEETKTLLLNLSIIHENGLFSVSAVPYFTEVPSLAGTIEYEPETVQLEEYNGSEKENIEQFLNNFFEKFTTESVDEMAYLMEEPQTMNGSFLFEDIRNLEIYVDGENYKVLMGVMFRDELTNIQQFNPVEMTVSKNGNNFYVEKFTYN
ncbi:conjugal transfer protein [Oceanobacillus polygoni]|uniref:Cobalamin biosynthesis Mg chelatase CobN n=1 Tax=Oceanobacillus polygoni TaxID=1235259 RepID=A0A9X0YW91_9BACI|nr:conjugal transfer protein [Oceanobacillus polygoni]MBP2079642.1 cobalamin biosynthesis Mg chelatase CobN [Oceanobacillus polygoni]